MFLEYKNKQGQVVFLNTEQIVKAEFGKTAASVLLVDGTRINLYGTDAERLMGVLRGEK